MFGTQQSLSFRQWVAFSLWAAGCLAMAVSVPMVLFEWVPPEELNTVMPDDDEFRVTMGDFLKDGAEHAFSPDVGDLFEAGSWNDFVHGPVLFGGLMGAYVLALPSLGLLLLALRSRLFLWLARAGWLLLLVGPAAFHSWVLLMREMTSEWAEETESWVGFHLGAGYWSWCAGVLLIAIAFWVMPAARRPGVEDAFALPEGEPEG